MTALSSKDRLLQRIADRSAHVGIVGIGYVGLPLAAVFGAAGLRVTGLDASAERVAAINAGRSYIDDVPTDVVAQRRAYFLHHQRPERCASNWCARSTSATMA